MEASAMSAKLPPSPPADLHAESLPIHTVDAGSRIFRVHQTRYAAKYFGRSGDWRFDAADKRSFGTLYAGLSAEVAFVETILRGRGRFVAQAELDVRSFCTFVANRPLKLVSLYGASLTKLKATAAISSGPAYDVSQTWAQAFWSHPDQPDGIVYRSAHDDDHHALVLFDRAAAAIDNGTSVIIMDDTAQLARILSRYDASLR
jgi:hypothetical protein